MRWTARSDALRIVNGTQCGWQWGEGEREGGGVLQRPFYSTERELPVAEMWGAGVEACADGFERAVACAAGDGRRG